MTQALLFLILVIYIWIFVDLKETCHQTYKQHEENLLEYNNIVKKENHLDYLNIILISN